MKNLKYMALFIFMISQAIGAWTNLLGWQGTPIEYNAYFQGAISIGIFLWLSHKMLSSAEKKFSKPIVNQRDKK